MPAICGFYGNFSHLKVAIMTQVSRFDQILESVENLSVDEQEALIDLIRHRLAERRRSEIADNIAQAQAEYQAGEVFRGNLSQIIDELRK
jgi:anthranilate/para-aminobenzoate synthase component I